MTRAADAAAMQRAMRREEAMRARGMGSARVIEAAKAAAPDPNELLPVSTAERQEFERETAVGRRFGFESMQTSRDGRVSVIKLGEDRERRPQSERQAETVAPSHEARGR